MMNLFRSAKVWALVAVVTTAGVPAWGQQTPVQQAAPPTYVVGQARPPLEAGHTLADMTLEQAMNIALEKNLDLKVARMDPQKLDYSLQSARAAFLQRYSTTYSYNNNTRPNNSLVDAVASLTDTTQNYNATMQQALPWFGGNYSVNFTNSKQVTNSANAQRNPAFNTALRFTYNQPLLAGFKIDNARNQLRTLSVQRQIADVTLLATIENLKANVRTSYWNLRQAIESIEIQQRNLELAQRLYQDNRVKVEIGTLAPIDVTQPEAAVASAEQQLLAAQITWQQAELNLKRLLISGPEDPLNNRNININPIEMATLMPMQVDIPAAIKNATENRTDMVTSRRNLEISQLNLEVTRNLLKPDLALQAGYNTSGLGGDRFDKGALVETGGYGQALSALRSLDTAGFNMSLNFTVPVGRDATTRKIDLTRAEVDYSQAQQRLESQKLTLNVQVTNAGLAVENTAKQYQAAQKSREAAQRNADAEQTRFDVGMSTNYNVVQALNQLTSARLSELRQLINYLNAVAEYERVQKVSGGGGN